MNQIKCGISSIDSVLNRGFPSTGVVTVCGSDSIYRNAITKEIAKNISINSGMQAIVLTKNFSRWATLDMTNAPITVLETSSIDDIYEHAEKFSEAKNRSDYPILIIDEISSRGSIFDIATLKTISARCRKNHLILMNFLQTDYKGVNIEDFGISASDLTLKITEANESEKGTDIKISIFGPYLLENRNV